MKAPDFIEVENNVSALCSDMNDIFLVFEIEPKLVPYQEIDFVF